MTFSLNPATDKWLNSNQLPRLPKAQTVANSYDGAAQYVLTLQQVLHDFHPKLKGIPVFTYGSKAPGPVIEAESGKPVRVSWFNGLVGKNLQGLISFGTTQGMEEDHMLTLSHNQVHLHGARVPWTSDGHPEMVFHPNEGRIFHYPNNQPACTLWYHDHTMDVTRLNVYAGLFGLYLVRDPSEKDLLPQGEREIALVLQDKSFSDDGTKLFYEQAVDNTVNPPEATPEFLGDYPLVNGRIWPTTTLEPLVYRLRVCNGANTRFFNLTLSEKADATKRLPFFVIGTEGGFLPAPVQADSLMIATGERYDVLIDLRGALGKTYILRNDIGIPYSPGTAIDPNDNCDELLQIKVRNDGDVDEDDMPADLLTVALPARIDPLPNDLNRAEYAAIDDAIDAVPIVTMEDDLVVNGRPIKLRRFKLEEYQLFMTTLPGVRIPTVQINAANWDTAAPVPVKKDAYEVWEFLNTTPDTHPMHIHLVQYQLMSRTELNIIDDPARVTPDLPEPKTITGYTPASRVAIDSYEQGWKDTASCHPGQATRMIMKFDGYLGDYVYHCHILEHEDMGMMYKIRVDS